MKLGRVGRAGQLNRPVQIQQRSSTVDAEGNPIVTWATVQTVWAAIDALSARERVQSGQLEQDTTHVLTMHYPASVTHESRILYGSRVFDVRTVVNVGEANRKLEVTCYERQISG